MRYRVLVGLCAFLVGAVAVAGDLNPPVGPVTGSMKTLDEVEPRTAINADNTPGDADSVFRIVQAGSYYLTGNVNGVVAKHGIEITVAEVTIDLNGFALLGVVGSLDGVVDLSGGSVAVRNGRVRDFGGDGVDINGLGCAAHDLVLTNNGSVGLRIGGSSVVSNVTSSFNGGDGIRFGSGTISGCSVESNGGAGMFASSLTTVVDCYASGNVDDDFQASQSVVFERCISLGSLGRGFDVGSDCALRDCTVSFAGLDGIVTGGGCVIESCVANGNNGSNDGLTVSAGIFAGADSVVRDCVVTDSAMGGRGIILQGSGRVEGCVARDNASIGISVFDPGGLPTLTIVSGCVVESNGNKGIVITNGGTVIDCQSNENATVGIDVDGDGCVVERCRVINNGDTGIFVSGAGSVIRGCTASGNTGGGIAHFPLDAHGGLIVGCTAIGNTGDGISATDGSIVRGCTSRLNTRFGIVTGNKVRVDGCDVSDNTESGIFAVGQCVIVNNVCSNNAFGALPPNGNIVVGLGGGCDVEGNSIIGGGFGILGLNSGNVVLGNRVTGCQVSYSVGGAFGPVVDITVGGDISAIPGADHPMANFIY